MHVVLAVLCASQIFVIVDSVTKMQQNEEHVWYELFLGDDDVSPFTSERL